MYIYNSQISIQVDQQCTPLQVLIFISTLIVSIFQVPLLSERLIILILIIIDGSIAGQSYVSTSTTSNGVYSLKFYQNKLMIISELQRSIYLTLVVLQSSSVRSYALNTDINVYSIDFEQKTQRFVFVGGKASDSYAYIAKSVFDSISDLPDMTRDQNMYAVTTISDKQINFNTGTSTFTDDLRYTMIAFIPTTVNRFVDSSTESNYTSDVSYWLENISVYHLASNTENRVSANLICSTSGSTTIDYSFSSDSGNNESSW